MLFASMNFRYFKFLKIRDLVLGLIPVESFNQERTPSMCMCALFWLLSARVIWLGCNFY